MEEKISVVKNKSSSDFGEEYDDYKCSICINFLNQPTITSCGHKFCHPCIKSWLQSNGICPICKNSLSMDSDTFLDKYTERKISQLRIKCPNAREGCSYQMPVPELEEHSAECIFSTGLKEEDGTFLCPFSKIGCKETFASEQKLEEHKQGFIKDHLKLALKKIAALERERSNEEKAAKLEKENQLIVNNCNHMEPVLNKGIFLWLVPDINEKVDKKETFSTKFLSSVHGYQFTVELSFEKSIAKIAIFIHKDAYKKSLTWPCKISSCRVSLLRHLANQTEGSFTMKIEDCSIIMPQTKTIYNYNNSYQTNVNSKNVIELIIDVSEIKQFAIDNKLYVKINMEM